MTEQFLENVHKAYTDKNGDQLSQLFYFDENSEDLVYLANDLLQVQNLANMVSQYFPESPPFADFVLAYFTMLTDYDENNPTKVYDMYSEMFKKAIKIFSLLSVDGAMMSKLMKTLSSTMVAMAFNIDRPLDFRSKKLKSSDATEQLTRANTITITDRTGVKKDATIHISNLLSKIYFKLNQMTPLTQLKTTIEGAGIDLEEYPQLQRVTYRYYLGRFYFLQQNLRQAETEFNYAFAYCPGNAFKNKRLILTYLIATRIILGRLPHQQLLMKYQLSAEFSDLITALMSCNFKAYRQALDAHIGWFLKMGIYLLLRERAQVIMWRCFFRKAFQLSQTHADPGKPPSFKLNDLVNAARFAANDKTLDVDDIECLMVSLISQGYAKGYLVHGSKTAVMAKWAPFPIVYSVVVKTETYDEELGASY